MGPAGAYFKHAMERMEQEKPGVRYIVFTNDMERAEEALAPVLESQKKDAVGQAENRLEFVSEMGEFSDVDEFFLMAACRHQIISNSSYSTWAAYLNPNPEKVVIMPEYKGCEQIRLKEWIVL